MAVYTEVSDDELEAILKTCSTRAPSGVRDRALLLLLRYGGLRIGEACGARKSNYRKNKGTLKVVHKHKTKSGRRTVAVADRVLFVAGQPVDIVALEGSVAEHVIERPVLHHQEDDVIDLALADQRRQPSLSRQAQHED